ncbi:MAG: hypothetical protein CMB99_02215 [Flavobacteriaceae bacterium]|nr:hypothetical protein [Flavobacteriaceae bacterium]|tara:strand:- start:7286 stop:8146 length:861 start_codon:yes stop_codon:yes gene_type:complete
MKKITLTLLLILVVSFAKAQEDTNQLSNIQAFTPSVLLKNGQWDVKFFNNLYTETKSKFNDVKSDIARQNFLTSTLEIFTGVSESRRLNLGVILEYRSNNIGGNSATSVLGFRNNSTSRNGLSSFAPTIKWQPIKRIGKFSITSSFHIPLIDEESDANNVFLDQTAYMFQNRFFYDYTFPSGKWQLFSELSTEYNFGDDNSFANNTYVLAPGLFMSYFPSGNSTILGYIQHYERFGDFAQNFTTLGFGGKYQLTQELNVEVLYGKFIRGTDTGLGESFNIGLRALF